MQQVFMGIVYAALVAGMATLGVTPEEPTAPAEPDPIVTVEKVEVKKVEEPVVEEPKPLDIGQLIRDNFGEQTANADKVMKCESGGRPDAVGDKGLQYWQDGILYGASYGLFQIRYLPDRPTPDKLLDPEFNVKYAADMQREHGWQPWSCKRVLY